MLEGISGFFVLCERAIKKKKLCEVTGGSYQEMFSPVLSHLAAEATSYYAWALVVTIIIIRRRPQQKNWSTHLADELPNDLLQKEMALGQPTCQHSLPPPLTPSLSFSYLSVSLTLSVAHSVSSFLSVTFEKWQTNEMTCMHTHAYTSFLHQNRHKKGFFSLTNTSRRTTCSTYTHTHTHTHARALSFYCTHMWRDTIFLSIPTSEGAQTLWFAKSKNLSHLHTLTHTHTHTMCCFILWCGYTLTTPCRDKT